MGKFNNKDFDVEMLPKEAKEELINFCQFLISKYKKIDKVKELKKLFMKPKGKLPYNYKFNREEVHGR